MLAALCLVLAGCPSSEPLLGLNDGDNSNIIQTSSGRAAGSAQIGSSASSTPPPSSSGATAGSSGAPLTCAVIAQGGGTTSDGVTGSNPTALSLGCALNVLPLYLDNGDFSCAIAGSKRAIAAVTSIQKQATETVQAAWSGGASSFRTQGAFAAHGETPQEQAERNLEARARGLRPVLAASRYRAQAGTTVLIGNTRTFRVLDANSNTGASTVVQADAVYVYQAPSGGVGSFVIWVDRQDEANYAPTSALVASIASQLRDHIYPTDTGYFGSDTTSADNNAEPVSKRIFLNDDYVHFVFTHQVDQNSLTTQGKGVFGFFYIGDLLGYDAVSNPSSNQAKVLYLAADAATFSPNDMYAAIAHEFQHLLFSCHRVKAIGLANHLNEYNSGRNAWLNEGLSMLAMFLNGYAPANGSQASPAIVSQIADFLGQPDAYSLTDFFQTSGNPEDAYGMTGLFCEYLHDRMGDGILKDLHNLDNSASMYDGAAASTTTIDPTDLIEQALAKRGSSMEQLFPDFASALALSGDAALGGLTGAEAARFTIQNVNLHGQYKSLGGTTVTLQGPAFNSAASAQLSLRPYSVHFLARSGLSGPVSLKFSNHTPGSGANFGTKLILE